MITIFAFVVVITLLGTAINKIAAKKKIIKTYYAPATPLLENKAGKGIQLPHELNKKIPIKG
jgi:hypothetical protein